MVKSVIKKTQLNNFLETTWHSIVKNTVKSLNLDKSKEKMLHQSPVAKLLAALPYCAGCKNPDQLAVLKVGMYLIGYNNPSFFAHREDQSIRERILPGTYCPEGDQAVVELVTDFLETISINDHIKDFEKDMKTGHPNPIGTSALFYYSRKEQIIRKIDAYPDQELVYHLKMIANPILLDWWGPDGLSEEYPTFY